MKTRDHIDRAIFHSEMYSVRENFEDHLPDHCRYRAMEKWVFLQRSKDGIEFFDQPFA